ncbi:hypothetical protein [Pedobacter sp. CFBP9032]|uniref:hypothetical protein n=1 Tax=Pedobacter sp. CFBP9032 TaxID=3096539 RepID=UPI002A6B0C3D|nr:hypothetical protein [Pedobacter sp. CFBP9032]MDY0906405.1 hypothetical protein [Pedobacter sp. CFBP9032]
MKKIFLMITMAMFSFAIYAQTKSDIVLKTNGDELKGKVTKISADDITFTYEGETLEYVLKKSEILKITHASGRVEVFAKALPAEDRQKDAVAMAATPVDHHNKIAILPFTFLMDNQPGAEQVGLKAQQDAFSFLSNHSAGYTILDPRTTNATLIQAGVTREKMMGFTMKNLSDILGVEYIIDGSVIQAKGYQTSSINTNADTKVKRDDAEKVKGVSSTSATYNNAVQRYDVSVSLHIYMDNNASIYNESHKAFLSNTDGSYTGPLEYLLKRCPLYRK